jgi:hypothetical protein
LDNLQHAHHADFNSEDAHESEKYVTFLASRKRIQVLSGTGNQSCVIQAIFDQPGKSSP